MCTVVKWEARQADTGNRKGAETQKGKGKERGQQYGGVGDEDYLPPWTALGVVEANYICCFETFEVARLGALSDRSVESCDR